MENFRLLLLIKDLLTKKTINSNFKADRSNFLANKTVMLVLGLYVKYNSIQNNSRLKQNFRFVYCSLKNISLHGIEAREDTKCRNFNRFFGGEYLENKKFLFNLFDIKVWYFRMERILSKTFSNRLSLHLVFTFII